MRASSQKEEEVPIGEEGIEHDVFRGVGQSGRKVLAPTGYAQSRRFWQAMRAMHMATGSPLAFPVDLAIVDKQRVHFNAFLQSQQGH
jgi:hypothetical protein